MNAVAGRTHCIECGKALIGHRYCDCRPERFCNECIQPHIDECPVFLSGVVRDPDGDLGLEDE